MTSSRIVIAPDSFKGSLPAAEVAAALAEGWTAHRPDDEVALAPMADGGEGTLAAFLAAVPGAERIPVRVTGPSGFARDSSWVRLPAPDGVDAPVGVVELASTSGIELLDGVLRGWESSTIGFGQAIAAALRSGVSSLILGIGSSASTDGGSGLLTALGARFTDDVETSIAPGASGLNDITRADLSKLQQRPSGGVTVLADVTAPLLGENGAAHTYGAQKGLTAEQVDLAESGLATFAEVVRAQAEGDLDPATPGAGAAGGAGFGLLVWGARIVSGASSIAEAIGLDGLVAGADLVITGEGRVDPQTATGKAPGIVADLAGQRGAEVAVVAGVITDDAGQLARDSVKTIALADRAGSEEVALADARRLLVEAGAELAQMWSQRGN